MKRTFLFGALLCALTTGLAMAALAQTLASPGLTFGTARVSITGSSNVHEYTASTTTVRVTRAVLGTRTDGGLWDDVRQPGGLEAFEIAIPAATLTSPKDGIDKNMHKALKVAQHPDITFRLVRFEATDTPGTVRAVGVLRIAGVERDITLDLTTQATKGGLQVQGQVDLLMTDYGITPPKAMLGMLRTEPKVTVHIEAVLAAPLT
jgi:hypothetical protein